MIGTGDNRRLLLVDSEDCATGYGEKISIHRNGYLHRAFSVFIFRPVDKKILIQKRAEGKYHSGGLWSNSCCSHQCERETLLEAVKRGIHHELGMEADAFSAVIEAGVFKYYADLGNMKEHEIDHVFVCCVDGNGGSKIKPNPEEIQEIRWISVSELDEEMRRNGKAYTYWFDQAYSFARNYFGMT